MDATTILTKASEVLADETKWTKHTLARTDKGRAIGAGSELACQWCLAGAVLKAAGCSALDFPYPLPLTRALAALHRAARVRTGKEGLYRADDYNDDAATNFGDIKSLIEDAKVYA